jgi:hypothetical protein
LFRGTIFCILSEILCAEAAGGDDHAHPFRDTRPGSRRVQFRGFQQSSAFQRRRAAHVDTPGWRSRPGDTSERRKLGTWLAILARQRRLARLAVLAGQRRLAWLAILAGQWRLAWLAVLAGQRRLARLAVLAGQRRLARLAILAGQRRLAWLAILAGQRRLAWLAISAR